MDTLQKIIDTLNNVLGTYFLIPILIGLGIYFTVGTKFVQFRYFVEMFKVIKEKPQKTKDGKKPISSFQAFMISTAARVGTGNLAGVATAITLGGPGAVFWMWIIALLGSATAFIETTLAQVYKVKDKDGFRGGPAYYMSKGLKARWMGILFAVLLVLHFGLVINSVQSNTISLAFENAFGINNIAMGVILSIITSFIVFGGVRRIAKSSEIIVAIMATLYIAIALYVVITNITQLPEVFYVIFTSAFGLNEAVGGTIGAAITMGAKRGLFSNEAGMGSSPNAGASATVSHPVKQGLIQSLGVFVDTLVMCSATAFIILLSENYTSGATGIELLQVALSEQIGSWASIFVAISVFLFAFSSIIANYFYGEINIKFITSNTTALNIYRFGVIAMVMVGTLVSLGFVWSLSDVFMSLMALTNLIAIALLGKVAFAVLIDYAKQRSEGKDPTFSKNRVKELKNQEEIECWDEEVTK